jgi:hypothetical protein
VTVCAGMMMHCRMDIRFMCSLLSAASCEGFSLTSKGTLSRYSRGLLNVKILLNMIWKDCADDKGHPV